MDRRRFLLHANAAALAVASPGLANAMTGNMHDASSVFPKDFLWGAATSAMQVEGSPLKAGGGPSIWDTMLRQSPGDVKDHSNNLVADDEFHQYPADIGIMQQIGLNAYRFSIGWPRVLPEGKGRVNAQGLAYYDRLIDNLLIKNITPLVTVYHFDYPDALQKLGGWLHPDSSRWLADYAHLLAGKFSDRVRHWLTINEPNIFWSFGSEAGVMPPKQKLSTPDLVRGAHHILLGHGRSVEALRSGAKQGIKVSLALAG